MTTEFDDLLAGGLVSDAEVDLPPLPEMVAASSLDDLQLPVASLAPARPVNPGEFGFPASLPIELAAGLISLPDLLDSYGINLDQLRQLQQNELFQAEYARAMAIRKEPNGLVKLQAAIMLPKVLESQYNITQDKDMPPAVRVKAGENIMALPADLYPKKAVDGGPVAQSIQIVFNAAPPGFVPNVQRGEKTIRTYDNGEES